MSVQQARSVGGMFCFECQDDQSSYAGSGECSPYYFFSSHGHIHCPLSGILSFSLFSSCTILLLLIYYNAGQIKGILWFLLGVLLLASIVLGNKKQNSQKENDINRISPLSLTPSPLLSLSPHFSKASCFCMYTFIFGRLHIRIHLHLHCPFYFHPRPHPHSHPLHHHLLRHLDPNHRKKDDDGHPS